MLTENIIYQTMYLAYPGVASIAGLVILIEENNLILITYYKHFRIKSELRIFLVQIYNETNTSSDHRQLQNLLLKNPCT